ncbi:MAG: phage tail protein [Spirochaetaceae bacterium]|nr:phage tail protein [Spirochaetaceae bacterium]
MLSRYEIDKTVEILENDNELTNTFSEENIYPNEDQYKDLAIVLLEDKETISDYRIDQLNQMVPSVARDDIQNVLNKDSISGKLYEQILYSFKYSTVKIFFRQNYSKFMPDYDFTVINSEKKMKLFTEAFMREYDRFANIIDEIYNIVDVDKAPEQYLNYLAQAVGYEREDSNLLNNVSFRELIKNIVEVYKIKGTNYSFELFFNFLGFKVDLKEYWFDKRFGDPGITSNPETGVSNDKLFSYYLTTRKPTNNIPDGMREPHVVSENQIVGTLDVNEFNRKINAGEYTPKQLTGEEPGYEGQHYTYFKTNVMQYSLENIKTEQGEGELSEADLDSIERYANFLTPIFMQKTVVVSIKPFQDYAGVIILSDADRTDPLSRIFSNESMFHFYQGYQPAWYYWQDGVRYYDEDIYRRDKDGIRSDISDPEGGGHFVSGFYKDTTEKMRDIRENLEDEYPNEDRDEISKRISDKISDKSIFNNNFPDRDVIPPYIEKDIYYPFRSIYVGKDEYGALPLHFNQNFSYMKGDKARFSEAFNEQRDSKTRVQSIIVDGGSGNSVVRISKITSYRYLKEGDTIKLMNMKNMENNGVYTVSSSTENGDYIDIELDGTLPFKQYKVGGFIQLYYSDWKVGEFRFPFLFDRFLNVDAEVRPSFLEKFYKYKEEEYMPKDVHRRTGGEHLSYDFKSYMSKEKGLSQSDYYERNVPLTYRQAFSFKKGDKKRFSEAFNEQLDDRTKIISALADGGNGNSLIRIKRKGKYRYISDMDQIKIMYMKNMENDGVYDINNISYTDEYIDIELDGQISFDQRTTGGFIQIYYYDWKIGDFNFPFMFDRILNVKEDTKKSFLDAFYEYSETFAKQVNIDRSLSNQLYQYTDEGHSIATGREVTSSSMREPYNFYKLSEYSFKMTGGEEITYNSTTYTRNYYDFYAVYPDFYWDYLDVAKT